MRTQRKDRSPVLERLSVPGKFVMGVWGLRFRSTILMTSLSLSFLMGCQSTTGNVGDVHSYPMTSIEAQWIRDGGPIKFEDELWYPADDTEIFLDPEMNLLGEYQGVQFFNDKTDVRPYGRLYTKFGRNKFRFFEKRTSE